MRENIEGAPNPEEKKEDVIRHLKFLEEILFGFHGVGDVRLREHSEIHKGEIEDAIDSLNAGNPEKAISVFRKAEQGADMVASYMKELKAKYQYNADALEKEKK